MSNKYFLVVKSGLISVFFKHHFSYNLQPITTQPKGFLQSSASSIQTILSKENHQGTIGPISQKFGEQNSLSNLSFNFLFPSKLQVVCCNKHPRKQFSNNIHESNITLYSIVSKSKARTTSMEWVFNVPKRFLSTNFKSQVAIHEENFIEKTQNKGELQTRGGAVCWLLDHGQFQWAEE